MTALMRQGEIGDIHLPLEVVVLEVKEATVLEIMNKDKAVLAEAGAVVEVVVVHMLHTEIPELVEKEVGLFEPSHLQSHGMVGTTQHRSKVGSNRETGCILRLITLIQ